METDRVSPRKIKEHEPQNQSHYKQLLLHENPTKLKFRQSSISQKSQFARIIQSFDAEEDFLPLDRGDSSKKYPSTDPTTNYKLQTVYGTVQCSQELDTLLKNPSKYIVYEVKDYYLALIGNVIMNLGITDRIALYISSSNEPLEYQGKPLVRVERRSNPAKPSIFDYNYFICEPSETLSPTLIFKWLNCARNTFLESYFGVDCTSYPMVLGLTGHSVLEKLVKKQIEATVDRTQLYRDTYLQIIQKMYILDVQEQTFLTDCQQKFSPIYQFYTNHLVLKKEIEVDKYRMQYLKVTKVVGAEYSIKSKVFGMKGKIDLLLECDYIDKKLKVQRRVIVPFELKTGAKQCQTHVYQVHVYNMVLMEMFEMESMGLLYYPVTGKVAVVTSGVMDVHEVLIKRNEYINHKKVKLNNSKVTLPKHVENPSMCGKCSMVKECVAVSLTQFKDIEDIQSVENYEPEETQRLISRINPKSKEYISKWLNLLHLEQRTKQRQYTLGLILGLDRFMLTDTAKLQNDMRERKQVAQIALRSHQLSDGHMSTIEGMFKVGEKVRMNIPSIRSSLYLDIQKIKKLNNRLFLICKAFIKNISFTHDKLPNEKIQVEIEKFGCSDSLSTERYTVTSYCLGQSRHSSYRFIVDGEKSEFTQDNRLKWYFEQNIKENSLYNPEQKEAIRKALGMRDFSLIEGYPGTGKTFLILTLIQIFKKVGMKVLVTSFTNTSLNNVLRKIVEEKSIPLEDIIRYGNKALREGEFKDLSFDPSTFRSKQEISAYFKSKTLWFVTLTSLYNEVIPTDFDVVIVDEASQCIEPLCVNALTKAKKFVLVGDYKQLGPVIIDSYAEKQGMRVSLFERLCRDYTGFTTALTKQWRMSADIMELTNNLVYDNALECATQEVANRTLKIDQEKLELESPLIKSIIHPNQPLVFLSMDLMITSIKNLLNTQFVNRSISQLQTGIASSLYSLFSRLGLPRSQISIISFFNRSNTHILNKLKHLKVLEKNEGDILTIDKSQGIDKECIIFLMESGGDYNALTRDVSRLNVSLTRAKSKLIVIGNKEDARETFNEKVFGILEGKEVEVTEEMVTELFGSDSG